MRFYFDEMLSRRVANELIARGHQVTLAVDVDMEGKEDFSHLRYAMEQQLILVTFDRPFAGLAMQQLNHAGVICLTVANQADIGRIVKLLDNFANRYSQESVTNQVFWLK